MKLAPLHTTSGVLQESIFEMPDSDTGSENQQIVNDYDSHMDKDIEYQILDENEEEELPEDDLSGDNQSSMTDEEEQDDMVGDLP